MNAIPSTKDGSVGEADASPQDCVLWQARAAMWELLALSLRYPDETLAEAVSSGEWLAAAKELAVSLDLEVPLNFGEEIASPLTSQDEMNVEDCAACSKGASKQVGCFSSTMIDDELLGTLRYEATRLFIGSPEPVVSPFEGVHCAQDDGVQALLFVNPQAIEVERIMKACGLGRPDSTNEPLDHIATECEFLQYLASVKAGIAALPNNFSSEDMPGGSPQASYYAFLEDHARCWIPRFTQAVLKETRHPFYRAAALLLDAAVEQE